MRASIRPTVVDRRDQARVARHVGGEVVVSRPDVQTASASMIASKPNVPFGSSSASLLRRQRVWNSIDSTMGAATSSARPKLSSSEKIAIAMTRAVPPGGSSR